MAAAGSESQQAALVLDFDSTLSTPTWLSRAQQWAVADNLPLFESMDEAEIIANLGGAARLATLHTLLGALEASGVVLHIVSIGRKAAIVPHLRAARLLPYFGERDCEELRSLGFVKGRLIKRIMHARGWAHAEVLFVDDSQEHLDAAAEARKCSGRLASARQSAQHCGEVGVPHDDGHE
ncbi:hypothetical protein EMIHUDRAFT_254707 [Emiliania huxleyi CCMP1516]|uniref:Uncharacterized protein n=2 Tax=Emiliania huxleyi TaxID=2903 RepID=A0A0D3JMP7_EMIH1|nr:hypothetical protein EMIHUDRAFT_254707 [Emiliania huxleyi CCMP1516]EOD24782.1 hypothetical protein EMIHUDRAFT_254707 [Emiliania huxleyi CCMP1516]|eukprot:XP_005777211.1 hypothetical protein EMIHUDRAFT_254707 [Emiliania huxleyi CCMP1516]